MKKIILFLLVLVGSGHINAQKKVDKKSSGNPIFPAGMPTRRRGYLTILIGSILPILTITESPTVPKS